MVALRCSLVLHTISGKIIAENRVAEKIVSEWKNNGKSRRRNLYAITDSRFFGEGKRGERREKRHRLDNTPCNSLADAVKLITFESLEVGRRVAWSVLYTELGSEKRREDRRREEMRKWEEERKGEREKRRKSGRERKDPSSLPLPTPCGCEVFCMCNSFVTRRRGNIQPRTNKKMYDSFQARIDTDKMSQYDGRKQGKTQGRPVITWRTNQLTLCQKEPWAIGPWTKCIKQRIKVKSG